MPALPFSPATVRCRLIGSNGTHVFNNVNYLKYSGVPPTPSDLNLVGNAVLNAWGTNFGPLMSTNVSMNEVELTDLSSDTAAQVTTTGTHPGTNVSPNDQAVSVAMVVSLLILRHYRGGHPRMYLPFTSSAHLSNGNNIQSTFVTQAIAAARGYRTALSSISISGTSYVMVCLSYYLNGALRPTPATFDIVDATVHSRVDSQRRRLGKETG